MLRRLYRKRVHNEDSAFAPIVICNCPIDLVKHFLAILVLDCLDRFFQRNVDLGYFVQSCSRHYNRAILNHLTVQMQKECPPVSARLIKCRQGLLLKKRLYLSFELLHFDDSLKVTSEPTWQLV